MDANQINVTDAGWEVILEQRIVFASQLGLAIDELDLNGISSR